MPDQDAAALEKMKKEIAAENVEDKPKLSFELPKNIKIGADVKLFLELFVDAIKNPKFGPENIVFYSLATGILKYDNVITYSNSDFIINRVTSKEYVYASKNDPYINLTISVEKNKAKITGVTTKEESKKIKEDEEKKDWYKTFIQLGDAARKMEKLIKAGVNQKLKEKWLLELSDLKKISKSLIGAIDDELEKN